MPAGGNKPRLQAAKQAQKGGKSYQVVEAPDVVHHASRSPRGQNRQPFTLLKLVGKEKGISIQNRTTSPRIEKDSPMEGDPKARPQTPQTFG